MCAVPYVSMGDAGTVELVRSRGPGGGELCELIQAFEADGAGGMATNLEAGGRGIKCARRPRADQRAAYESEPLQEVEVTEPGARSVRRPGIRTLSHCGRELPMLRNPHYEHTDEVTSPIRGGR